MNKSYCIIPLVILLMACGGGNDHSPKAVKEKTARLEKLKADKAKIDKEITALEKELNKNDSVQNKSVVVATLDDTTFTHFIDVQGSVDARENVNVSSRMMGTITAIYVHEGARVSEGQSLAQVDDQVLKANMAELHTQLDLANTLYEKQKNLWSQQIGSEVQFLNAKSQKESLERRIGTMQEQLNQSRITSPITGTVDAVIAKVGDVAQPGNPAFRVVNTNNLKIVANIAEAYAGHVHTGDAVQITFPDISKTIQGRISFAAQTIDPLSRTIRVEVQLAPDAGLKANMVAQIQIVDYQAPNVITVPVNVVQYSLGKPYVVVAQPEKSGLVAKRRPIEMGRTYNDRAEVKSGLKYGEQLIVTGFQDLNDNDPVQL